MSRGLLFNEYNGTYPNLCGGTLVFKLDGEHLVFPVHCLYTTGGVQKDKQGEKRVFRGPWMIREFPPGFPEKLEGHAVELVNEHIRWGCCGGCLKQSAEGEI